MATLGRWRHAQQYERGYWESLAARIAAGSVSQLDWYRWRADRIVNLFNAIGQGRWTEGSARVIEVGCGPIGTLSHFPATTRIAVDPLEPFYRTNPVLTALRNPAVQYYEGVGEELPCDSGSFDVAIIDNCIDHVRDVRTVMSELVRVLRPGGIVFLTVNCRTPWGFFVHRVLSRLRFDPGHPHSFTPGQVRALFVPGTFRIVSFEVASYGAALKEDLKGPGARQRLKGLLGVSEFVVTVVAERVAAPHTGQVVAEGSAGYRGEAAVVQLSTQSTGPASRS